VYSFFEIAVLGMAADKVGQFIDSWLERKWVSRRDSQHGLQSLVFVLFQVPALDAETLTLAVFASPEALAVKLETLGLLAIAAVLLVYAWVVVVWWALLFRGCNLFFCALVE
jgi:hypothetical protein